jgi:hypothetical protein
MAKNVWYTEEDNQEAVKKDLQVGRLLGGTIACSGSAIIMLIFLVIYFG